MICENFYYCLSYIVQNVTIKFTGIVWSWCCFHYHFESDWSENLLFSSLDLLTGVTVIILSVSAFVAVATGTSDILRYEKAVVVA